MKRRVMIAVLCVLALLVPVPVLADVPGECTGDICGTPDESGGTSEGSGEGDRDHVGDVCDPDIDGDKVVNVNDNCPVVRNPTQMDTDSDTMGDACLDPSSVFAVYAGEPRVIRTGEKLPLLFWANRKNRALEYEWTIVDRPEKSTATIKHPRGSSTLSTPYNYHYKLGRRVTFTPDYPGEYIIKLSARMVFEDDLYPSKRIASTQLYLTVKRDPITGCSTAGMGAVASLWFLLGFAWLSRRMSHRNDA